MSIKFIPLAQYYEKHGAQIEAMLPTPSSAPGGNSLLLDLAATLVPFVKRHWPALNTNGLLDDTLTLLGIELT